MRSLHTAVDLSPIFVGPSGRSTPLRMDSKVSDPRRREEEEEEEGRGRGRRE